MRKREEGKEEGREGENKEERGKKERGKKRDGGRVRKVRRQAGSYNFLDISHSCMH